MSRTGNAGKYIVVMVGVGHVAEGLTMYNAARECAVKGSGAYVVRADDKVTVAYFSEAVNNVHRTNNATPAESEDIAAVPFHVAA